MSQANLLEEQIQSAIGSLIPEDNTTAGFLQAQIYPTLVPAVEALLKQFEACEAEGKAPPEPLDWLARCVSCPALQLLEVKSVSSVSVDENLGLLLSWCRHRCRTC